jgi:hypothetical protein
MRINYHILSAKISDRQTFREYIHGASRYTQLVNTSSLSLSEKLKIDNNEIQLKNNEVHTQIGIFNEPNEDNEINFTNGKVNMSASYLIRLKMMSGSLNSYYNQTISETGRKKII